MRGMGQVEGGGGYNMRGMDKIEGGRVGIYKIRVGFPV